MGGRQTSRNTMIEARISIQLHWDYREYRPCATDSVEAHFQYHFTLFLTAGLEAGVEAFGLGAALALGLAIGTGVIRLGCGVLGLLIGFGAGFGCGQLRLPPMVTLRLILALSSKVVITSGPGKS